MTVPWISPIISSAMVAATGSGEVFSKRRDFAAWLGLVPRQISTGDRTILGMISNAAIVTCASCSYKRPGWC
jgi:transposase